MTAVLVTFPAPLAVLALVAALVALALTPRARLTRALLAERGPRTETSLMTRGELMASARWHLYVSLVAGCVPALVVALDGARAWESDVAAAAALLLSIVAAFVVAVFLLASVLLFVRGALRAPWWTPPSLHEPYGE